MKKYVLILLAVGVFAACEPTGTSNLDVNDLVAEWKNTSQEARALSEKLGKVITDWQVRYGNDSIEVANENSDCVAVGKAYLDMQIKIQSFLDSWEMESAEVERLTNQLTENSWTEEERNQLTSLKLAIDEKDTEIERWEYNLDSLQKNCPTPTEPVIEK